MLQLLVNPLRALVLIGSIAAPSLAQCGNETLKLLPDDGEPTNFFGSATAASGTTLIVGARSHEGTGAAYLFDISTGQQLAELQSIDREEEDWFGFSVGISGTTAIVGADGNDDLGSWSGSAYLFDTMTGQQTAKLLPSDGAEGDRFGVSVGISGTTAIVGASQADSPAVNSGAAYLFDTITGQQIAKLQPHDGALKDRFGLSVAISGTIAIVGAPGNDALAINSGAAYLFDTVSGQQIAKLAPADGTETERFGRTVAISGTTVIVGMTKDSEFGVFSGSAYLFDAMTGERLAKLLASDGAQSDGFGFSVAIHGTTAVVGAPGNTDAGTSSGAAYLFDTVTGQQTAKLLASDGNWSDLFGGAVAISGTTAIVGAERDDDFGSNSGAAYMFSTESIGSSYCMSNDNSTGHRAAIDACGSASIADNDLVLTAQRVPNQLYVFFYGQSQIQVPFGEGFLCAGGNTFRLNSPALAQGYVATLVVDLPLQVGVPGTLHFQCWFRDPHPQGTGFNLSNGVSVTFTL